jgi:outer membrane receptor protein involved in Fe transport
MRHQGRLRSQHDLARNVQLDLMARVHSRELTFGTPGVLLLDVRLGWRPVRAGELSVAMQNATNRKVLESLSQGPFPAIPLRRTFVVKWTQQF